jgi:hypothetical protein
MHHALKGLKAAWFSQLVNVRAFYDSDIQLVALVMELFIYCALRTAFLVVI